MENRESSVSEMVSGAAQIEALDEEVEGRAGDYDVSRALSDLRCSQKLTQEELAERAGCTQSKISRIENSSNDRLKLDDLTMYARAFNMQVSIDFTRESSSADATERLARQIRSGLVDVAERARHQGVADEGAKKTYEAFLFSMLELFMDKLKGLRARRNGSPESGETTRAGNGKPMGPAGQIETSSREKRNNGSTVFRIFTPIDINEENGRTESQREG
ncbi:MAG: helix-turn-helix transcriptional regulator [Gemmatimonadetes bacterium]|nr:helix-turn-helix transcriptional regulator [Gemmatimonadota bacterium]